MVEQFDPPAAELQVTCSATGFESFENQESWRCRKCDHGDQQHGGLSYRMTWVKMLKLVGCVGWFSYFFSKKISEILQMFFCVSSGV